MIAANKRVCVCVGHHRVSRSSKGKVIYKLNRVHIHQVALWSKGYHSGLSHQIRVQILVEPMQKILLGLHSLRIRWEVGKELSGKCFSQLGLSIAQSMLYPGRHTLFHLQRNQSKDFFRGQQSEACQTHWQTKVKSRCPSPASLARLRGYSPATPSQVNTETLHCTCWQVWVGLVMLLLADIA